MEIIGPEELKGTPHMEINLHFMIIGPFAQGERKGFL
jgi:hypothetical protein